MAGPDCLVRVAVLDHHLPQEEQPRKVQHRLVNAPVVRAGVKAVGLGRYDVKVGRGTRLVELLQEAGVTQVLRAGLDGGGQAGQEDAGVGIGGADGAGGAGQEIGVGGRVDGAAAPVGRQVRLVPHLVIVHLRAVAGGEGTGESGEAVRVGRWG